MRVNPDSQRPRRDLLAYLARHAANERSVVRAERWRIRGWTSSRVATEAEHVAGALVRAGVTSGDRVALYLNDGPLWHAAFFGVLRAGAVAVPLDAALEPARLRDLAADLELVAWCAESELPELGLDLPRVELSWHEGVVSQDSGPSSVPPWPPDDPDRIAQIVLTSGTSGAPKAVRVTHRNIRTVLEALEGGVERYRRWLRLAPPLRIAVALPLSHLYGQVMGVFVPSFLPADVTFLPAMPGAELARALRDQRAWSIATVPRTLALLADHLRSEGVALWGESGFADRLARARSRPWWRRRLMFARLHRVLGSRMLGVVSGGAALDPELESFWRATGYAVVQGYGLTETAPLVTLAHPFDPSPGSLGRPLPGVEVQIAFDGEILVRGPNVAPGRLGGPSVDVEGWLHTGDLGRWEEGRLVSLGRKGERIVTPAGVNVDTEPIVTRLKGRGELLDALVLERPWGPPGIVTAVLLVRPGADPGAAVTAVNRELPDAARIRDWHVWPEPDFPRTRTGKPRRPEIRDWLRGLAPADAAGEVTPSAGMVVPGRTVTPADPVAALVMLAAQVAGLPSDQLDEGDAIGDVLTSLDRVELATLLEATYGVTLGFEAFAGEKTLREVAEEAFAAATPRSAELPIGASTRGGTAERSGHGERAEEQPPESARTMEIPRSARSSRTMPLPVAAVTPPRRVSAAQWRHWLPVRAARHAVREVVIKGFWRPAIETRLHGLDRLGGLEPPFLVAANHLSILDPLAILFALPFRLRRRLAPSAMWEHFARGRKMWQYWLAVLGLNLVPLVQVGDWRPTLRVAGRLADQGWCPLVFPEGARSDGLELLPFRLGTAIMARELHLPIVPCALMGTLAVMPRGAKWFSNCWIGRAPVGVAFGEPLAAPGIAEDPRAVTDELRRRIDLLRDEALAAAGRA